jgi:hypothetical protein
MTGLMIYGERIVGEWYQPILLDMRYINKTVSPQTLFAVQGLPVAGDIGVYE